MATPIHKLRRQMPHHISKMVRKYGRYNVYWADARRQYATRDFGAGVDVVQNGVIGSDLSATQPTPSAQPVFRGDHFELAGDDYVFPQFPTAFSGLSAFFVTQCTVGTGRRYLMNFGNSSNGTEIRLRYDADEGTDSNGRLVGQTFDQTGSGSSTVINSSVVKDRVSLVGTRIQPDGFHTAYLGEDYAHSLAPGGIVGPFDEGVFGTRTGLSQFYMGDVYEIIVVRTALPDDEVDHLIEHLREKWRILPEAP